MSAEQSNFLTGTISEKTYIPFNESEWLNIKIGTYVRILLKNNSSTKGGRLISINKIQDSDKVEFSVKHYNCKNNSKVHIDDIQKIYQLKDDKKTSNKEAKEEGDKTEIEGNKESKEEGNKESKEDSNKEIKEDGNKESKEEGDKSIPAEAIPKNKKSSDVISLDSIKVIKYIMPRLELLEDKVKTIESNIKKIIEILKSK